MDDQKCIEYLNSGITEKRNGNYDQALFYYKEACQFNPFNPNIYYNIGKLYCGLGEYDKAIKNFLTYAHLIVYDDEPKNKISNFISAMHTMERINNAKFSLPIGASFPSNWFKKILADKRLLMLLGDVNLTFYTGFAFIANKSLFLNLYSISEAQIQDLKNGLLGKFSNTYLKSEKYEFLIMSYGLMLILENLNPSITKENILEFYFNNGFQIKSPLIDPKINIDDFLDRNPMDKELDNLMIGIQNAVKTDLALKNIYLGYNLITNMIFEDPGMFMVGAVNIGHTGTFGFDSEDIEKLMKQCKELYLCYLAIPIDEGDYLIEKEGMLDWEFENYLSNKLNTDIVTIGSLTKNEYKRCRTFKFFFLKQ